MGYSHSGLKVELRRSSHLPISRNRVQAWKTIVIVILFLAILIGARLFWIAMFYHADQPHAVNGRLDLRGWDAEGGQTIKLDGEWEFYPHAMLADQPGVPPGVEPHILSVPGKWNDSMQPEESTPYGYGSYRLQILVNPEDEYTYTIRIPSVRSSSALYVNGRLLAQSGVPSAEEKEYVARNVPYSASFSTNGSEVIDIVIQAANYKDSRGSGIIRSIKFGTEAAMARETQLSINMQFLYRLLSGLYCTF